MDGYNVLVPDICRQRAPQVTLPVMNALQELGHTPVVLSMAAVNEMYQQIRNRSHGCYEIFGFYVADLLRKNNIDFGISVGLSAVLEDAAKHEAHNLLEECGVPSLILLSGYDPEALDRLVTLGAPAWRHTFIGCSTAATADALSAAGLRAFHVPPATCPRLFYPQDHRPADAAYPLRSSDPWLVSDYSVSFVGRHDALREEYLLALAEAGIPLAIWGDEAWGGCARLKPYWRRQANCLTDVNTIYNASLINLDLPREAYCQSDYVSQRVVDCLASHGFLATWRRKAISRYFEPEREVAVFSDAGELLRLVQYYLQHERERLMIATRANGKMLTEFTWTARIEQLMPRLEMHLLSASVSA